MIITKQVIKDYISLIPPSPKTLIECNKALEKGDLSKAAKISSEDRAFVAYLKNIVNKPIFGFSKEINDVNQMFSALGVVYAKQLVNSYLLTLIMPKKWEMLHINDNLFTLLQSELMFFWNKIIEKKACKNKEIIQAISLVPASIIVCEELFKNAKEEIAQIEGAKTLSKDMILYKLTSLSFFDLACMIAKKWEFSEEVISLIRAIPRKREQVPQEVEIFSKFAHLLLFYEFSKPEFLNSGLNSFFELDGEYIADINEEFFAVVGLA